MPEADDQKIKAKSAAVVKVLSRSAPDFVPQSY